MRVVSTSYVSVPEINDPVQWLEKISYYTGVFEALAKKHEVISIERINYKGILTRNGVKYIFTRLSKVSRWFPFGMHRKIKKLEPGVVLVHGLHFPFQVWLLRKKLDPGVKIFCQHHAERPGKGLRKFFQRKVNRLVDGYFFTSKEMGMDWVKAGIIRDPGKIHEVMEASSIFSQGGQVKIPGDPVFLWVGRLNRNKDPLTVLKAFARYLQDRPSARLYMIYHTAELEPELKEELKADPLLEHSVQLVGKVDHGRMAEWYNAAGFLVAASLYEGSGVAVCEAMSCGCIPILSDIPSFRRMTNSGNCGILFEAGNVHGLTEAFIKAGQSDRQREKEKVLAQFHQHLSFEAIARDMNQAFISA